MFKYFSLSAFLVLLSPTLWAEDIVLTYEAENKWLTQEHKAPLLKLRESLVASGQKKVSVVLPNDKSSLQHERLLIVSEILGRKVPELMVVQVSGTTPLNTMHFSLGH